jgi:hypothetical protein
VVAIPLRFQGGRKGSFAGDGLVPVSVWLLLLYIRHLLGFKSNVLAFELPRRFSRLIFGLHLWNRRLQVTWLERQGKSPNPILEQVVEMNPSRPICIHKRHRSRSRES